MIGVFLGWSLNEWHSPDILTPPKIISQPTDDPIVEFSFELPEQNIRDFGDEVSVSRNAEPENPPKDENTDLISQLQALLKKRSYQEAISLYQNVASQSETDQKRLKTVFLDHLNLLLKQDRANDFIELTNLYLSVYFEDIDVLLLLATFNKDSNLYVEAVGVYQLAAEYAYSLKSQKKVENAFEDFIRETDSFLSRNEDWYNLSQVFFQAELVGLLKPKYQLRQAEVYLINGERYDASRILNTLIDNNTLAAEAKELLNRMDGDTDNYSNDGLAQNHSSALQLERRGNQYIADLGLSGTREVKLLIDTGASLTTLSQLSFDRIRGGIRYEYVGDRMFSTANGLVKGEVYHVDNVSIANYSLEKTAIAVLDFGIGGDIDGLLGMNVLGKFKFQIEQDKSQLLLSPR